MRVAFFVDEVPFPPRNGITIPTHQLCEALRAQAIAFELFVAVDAAAVDEPATHAALRRASEAYGAPCRAFARTRRAALPSLRDELLHARPRFANWSYTQGLPDLGTFDVAVASPISVLDAVLAARRPGQRTVACINDAYAAVLATDDYGRDRLGARVAQGTARARARRMRAMEAALLRQVDRVVVQTPRDRAWVRLIGGRELAARTRVHHNAANRALFDVPVALAGRRPVVVYSADLKSLLYQRILGQLLDVWPRVLAAVPGAELHVTGASGALPPDLQARVRGTPGVRALGFVERIEDVYRHARLAIAPVNKRYGFINKVAEPVAAGVPVVADASAFNGMESLVATGACFVAEAPAAMVETVVRMLTDDAAWLAAASRCRDFANAELVPERRQRGLLQAVLEAA